MMYYIESRNTDPYYNLALEQHVFDNLDPEHDYFMLWQNDNAVIIGKHQNAMGEINAPYVKEKGITVARRLSGGGAVYHDLGNLNFTFIADAGEDQSFDFGAFCRPVAKALAGMGVEVEISGRNDMTIDGKKFSGNAQYQKRGRVMHHGTLLFDSDLQVISQALQVSADKIESKGIQSVRSRVTNIKPHLPGESTLEEFWSALRGYMFRENEMSYHTLTKEDYRAVEQLRDSVYSKWEWNYGASPASSVRKERRVEGCGKVEIYLRMGKGGLIEDIAFHGDYFGNGDSSELAGLLRGKPLNEATIRETLNGVEIGWYFNNLTREDFLAILLQ